jgi:hypothetical protein
MTIHEFANRLNGRECPNEITKEEEQLAKSLGLVVIFGYSDDNTEFRGAIYDEVGSWERTTIYFDKNGLLKNECDDEDCPYFERLKESAKIVDAVWCDPEYFIDGEGGYCWTYKTNIPHATFDILKDGEKFCRGIVFDINSLKE